MTEDKDNGYTQEASDITQSEKSGKGKAGKGGSGGGIRIAVDKLKEIVNEREYLDATKVVARLAEFFSELPARASANIEVKWDNLKNHGYAIVTQLLKSAEISRLMFNLTRENMERLRREFGIHIAGPSG